MAALKGRFDSAGNPVITIGVFGAIKTSEKKFDAIVDTGFTGFLFLPLAESKGLHLKPIGSTSVTLADKSTCHCLTASGTVTLDGEEVEALIILEQNSTEVLVGMGFLRGFKKTAVISGSSVTIMDDSMTATQKP